jgi:hypothetical protein
MVVIRNADIDSGMWVISGRNWMLLELHFVSVTATCAVALFQTKTFLRPPGMSDVTVRAQWSQNGCIDSGLRN